MWKNLPLHFLTICDLLFPQEQLYHCTTYALPVGAILDASLLYLSWWVYLISLWTLPVTYNYCPLKFTLPFQSVCFHSRSGLHNQRVINIIYGSFMEPCLETLVGEEYVRSLFPFAVKPDEDVSHINVNSMTGERGDGSSLDGSLLTLKIRQQLGTRKWRWAVEIC